MELIIPLEATGIRLDKFLAGHFPEVSRNRLQDAIEKGEILVQGERASQKYKLKGTETVSVNLQACPVLVDLPEPIPLRIVYEDDALLVLNKSAGLTVHPGAGQHHGTLLNALLYHDPNLIHLPRAGIVHRLDKDTSGLMVVAKTDVARLRLTEALKIHAVERIYIALVQGELLSGCTINLPLGRHPVDRKKRAVLEGRPTAKDAVTHIRVLEKFKGYTLVEARLETGRTHQIRVHLAHLGYPLVGDKMYGRKNQSLAFPRQALQAIRLVFRHPVTQEAMRFEIEREGDIAELLQVLYNKPV